MPGGGAGSDPGDGSGSDPGDPTPVPVVATFVLTPPNTRAPGDAWVPGTQSAYPISVQEFNDYPSESSDDPLDDLTYAYTPGYSLGMDGQGVDDPSAQQGDNSAGDDSQNSAGNTIVGTIVGADGASGTEYLSGVQTFGLQSGGDLSSTGADGFVDVQSENYSTQTSSDDSYSGGLEVGNVGTTTADPSQAVTLGAVSVTASDASLYPSGAGIAFASGSQQDLYNQYLNDNQMLSTDLPPIEQKYPGITSAGFGLGIQPGPDLYLTSNLEYANLDIDDGVNLISTDMPIEAQKYGLSTQQFLAADSDFSSGVFSNYQPNPDVEWHDIQLGDTSLVPNYLGLGSDWSTDQNLSSVHDVTLGQLQGIANGGLSIASLSSDFESQGNVGSIGYIPGDTGGYSYGVYQITTAGGNMADFLQNEGSEFASQFNGLTPGTSAFNTQYVAVAANSPTELASDELDYITRKDYAPLANYAQNLGFDTNDPGMQAALFSLSVNTSPTGGHIILNNAASALDLADDGGVDPTDQIGSVYSSRIDYVQNSTVIKPNIQSSLVNRYNEEGQDAQIISEFGR
jgi:hypothetical protein